MMVLKYFFNEPKLIETCYCTNNLEWFYYFIFGNKTQPLKNIMQPYVGSYMK